MYDYKEVYVFVSIFLTYLVIPFQPFAQEPVTDFDGNNYKTVRIGDQVWMAENLRSFHDADGNKIKRVCYQLIRENCDEFGDYMHGMTLRLMRKMKTSRGFALMAGIYQVMKSGQFLLMQSEVPTALPTG